MAWKMVQYLQFRYLKWPLSFGQPSLHHLPAWAITCTMVNISCQDKSVYNPQINLWQIWVDYKSGLTNINISDYLRYGLSDYHIWVCVKMGYARLRCYLIGKIMNDKPKDLEQCPCPNECGESIIHRPEIMHKKITCMINNITVRIIYSSG